jgi:hypothetical protein
MITKGANRKATFARGSVWVWVASASASLAVACSDTSGTDPDPMIPDVPESSPEEQAAVVIFDDNRVHDVRIEMAPEDWRSIIDDSRGDEWRRAKLFIDGVIMADVGVRPSGESSRIPGNPKMSMRVQFDAFREGKKLGGFDNFTLTGSWDDPFLARDRLAYWCFRQMMPAPREVAAQLAVNGELRGSYEIEERWDRDSLQTYFEKPFGPLYRMRGVIGLDPYEYKGLDPAVYVPMPWDPVGDHPEDDHSVIGNMLRVMTEDPANLGQVMDVDMMLNYFAGNALLANTDGFTGELEVDDHYQYRDPVSGHFMMLPWDPDNTFGSINDPPERDIFQNFSKSALTRLVRDSDLRNAFFAKLEAWMSKIPLEAINAQTDRIHGQIRDTVAKDMLKQYPTDHFDWSVTYIKDFIAKRYASVRAQIATYRAGGVPSAGVAP